ncbi:MAG: hypothetical protein HW377_1346 [Actinobacteria bacterium]|nr:hypothetical protein [Actinomycetota bacterium]
MSNQVYYEDVLEGQDIPSIRKDVTNVNILMYLSTVWLMDRIHFDYLFATLRRGLPDVVAPGPMGGDYYAQLLGEFAGEKGEVRKMSIQFRNFMVPSDVLLCGGKITKKYMEEGKGFIELDLWLKKDNGINCAPGKGLVTLPVREAKTA